ncbi:hypothetical protein SAMN05880501_101300 [Ureibacillus xyleni]|uniref:6-hydroxymethylpterin diphosphokinase MptE-like domain-containing protein n=1 Tax=Ureibacillus xyleni TaxID=614648 RepID=A0A285RBA4_9BACL|nr:6-hydroxymethylpterin diphosphokinase MptE-like protein [Ureibacillus xyleni]SOB91385.1 hypothetical protein SAMN05880501_101300 [Ureibacillus xyleni]
MNLMYIATPFDNIQVNINETTFFLHDMNNPWIEAEKMLEEISEEIDKKNHIVFWGVGIGYLVKLVTDYFPDKKVTIYEPIEGVFQLFQHMKNKLQINSNKMMKEYTGTSVQEMIKNIKDFEDYIEDEIMFIRIPNYYFMEEAFTRFYHVFDQMRKDVFSNNEIIRKFSDFWVINRLKLKKEIEETTSFIDYSKPYIQGKPVIIVAAGPSLNDELNNLRIIKHKKMAYIFAMGSANKALIENGIFPDAIFTYDPQPHNQFVISKKIVETMDIPLIYGTTVGFETVMNYKGKKFYFVTQRDQLSPFLYKKVFPVIRDTSTISNITLQVLSYLEPSHVILVGQNFAFRSGDFYAKGIIRISNKEMESKAFKHELERGLKVEAVDGTRILTSQEFEIMKKEMEAYLRILPLNKVINCTYKGAKIKGVEYKSLSFVMKNELKNSLIDSDWYKNSEMNTIQKSISDEQLLSYSEELTVCIKYFLELLTEAGKDLDISFIKEMENLFKKLMNNPISQHVVLVSLELEQKELLKEMKYILDKVKEPKERVYKLIHCYEKFVLSFREKFKWILVELKGQ